MPGVSGQGIFLSYRREDAGPYARSLQLQLSQRIPEATIFMDLDSIEPGLDFAEVIEDAVTSSAVLVALIGRQWATLTDEEGTRRLDNPHDFVRFEVKTALKRGVRVIPVLLDGARPLQQQELPAELRKLARLNALKLSYDRYQDDADRLLDLIQRVLTVAGELAEAERKAREEAERQAREEAERKAREEAERQAREEDERKAREEDERQAREEDERKAREEDERKAREEDERKAREEADRQARELAAHYALACTAAANQDWDQALTVFTMIANVDPDYRDVRELTENARKQQQIVRWQAEAHQLYQAGRWAAVVKVGQRLHALDPTAADPEGLVTAARAELAAAEQADRLAADYERARRLLDAGECAQAIDALEQITHVNPAYRAAPALLEQARRQLASNRAAKDTQPSGDQRGKAGPQPSQAQSSFIAGTPQTLQVGSELFAVAFSPDGTRLATGDSNYLCMWNLQTGATVWKARLEGSHSGVDAVAFSPDGTRLATGSRNKTAQIWNVTTRQQQLEVDHGKVVEAVAFSPDGARLATGGGGRTARIWDAATGRQQLQLTRPGRVTSVAFSPDGTRLATGGGKAAWVWDATIGKLHLKVNHAKWVTSVAFSPDGTKLATGSGDKTARIWDATTGQQKLQLAHEAMVTAVAFSPDGTRLATGSGDKTARIWDATTGQQKHRLAHDDEVTAVAFSPDGTKLATGSYDKTARVWPTTPLPR
jgi:WD40 repeat protein